MTGKSRIPCVSDPLPAANSSVAGDRQAARKALRTALKEMRGEVDELRKMEWDTRIGAQLLVWCLDHPQPALAVYWPLPGEPDLRPAYAELSEAGIALALPVVLERDAPLAFAAWIPGEAMEQDAMGVMVPRRRELVARPPALLLPCLGFNAQRYRLGYGGGYYDRTLAGEPQPATVGVAYSCQQVEFEAEEHDIALDTIITEATEPPPAPDEYDV